MNQFRGLRMTPRAGSILTVLMLALIVVMLAILVDRVQDAQCRDALVTGTQWRIDRVCEPEESR